MNKSNNVYKTVKSALAALCLDTGFNPIRGRITKEKLCQYGYIVDSIEWKKRQTQEYTSTHCRVCGCSLNLQNQYSEGNMHPENICWDCMKGELICTCDNGHEWKAKKGDICPKCGEYWV